MMTALHVSAPSPQVRALIAVKLIPLRDSSCPVGCMPEVDTAVRAVTECLQIEPELLAQELTCQEFEVHRRKRVEVVVSHGIP